MLPRWRSARVDLRALWRPVVGGGNCEIGLDNVEMVFIGAEEVVVVVVVVIEMKYPTSTQVNSRGNFSLQGEAMQNRTREDEEGARLYHPQNLVIVPQGIQEGGDSFR
jgi:hypothetical protein